MPVFGLLFLIGSGMAFAKQGPAQGHALDTFTANVKQYAELHRRLDKGLPKLSRESEAHQVAGHQDALAELIRTARVGAKHGDIFDAESRSYIRRILREELKGTKGQQLRAALMSEKTAGVPLRVNDRYPDTKALSLVPPGLLLKLPQLPEPLEYRFAGRHMLLLDKKADLIVDVMPNAIP